MKYLLDGERTERLDFRLLEERDFEAWLELFKTEGVARFLGMDLKHSPTQHCEKWFDKIFHRYENDLGGMNVLIDRESGAFIGQCGLLIQTLEDEERMEIGYAMLPAHWGKGYASEAALRHKELAFERNYRDSLISIVHVENIGSEKVARKNGMSIEKKLDDYKGMPVNVFRVDKV